MDASSFTRHDARNNPTRVYFCEHWQSTGWSQQSERTGAEGLQGAKRRAEMWTVMLQTQPKKLMWTSLWEQKKSWKASVWADIGT